MQDERSGQWADAMLSQPHNDEATRVRLQHTVRPPAQGLVFDMMLVQPVVIRWDSAHFSDRPAGH